MDLFNPDRYWPEELKTEARKFRELNLKLKVLNREIETVNIIDFASAFDELERCREAESEQWKVCMELYTKWCADRFMR